MLPSTAGLDAEATTERLRAREYMRYVIQRSTADFVI